MPYQSDENGNHMKYIVVVEDNPEIKILIEGALNEHRVIFCSTILDAKNELKSNRLDLLLLDIELPDGDGLQFLSELISSKAIDEKPIIILSGKTTLSNKVMAFTIGAEDFISKPFEPIELKARVNSKLLKYSKAHFNSEFFSFGDLEFDIPKQKVWVVNPTGQRQAIETTSLEFKLLIKFVKSPERIFSRENLLDDIWGANINVNDRTVDTHIGHIRKKLSSSKIKIETVVGTGYRIII